MFKNVQLAFICSSVVVSLLLLSGCATVFTGTNQSIHVSATDQQQNELQNVNCSIVDSSGANYHLSANPGAVLVNKGSDPLQVRCEQAGYKNYSGAINSSFNTITLLDVLFWPGFIVDFATGAAMKYPGQYDVVMKQADAEKLAQNKN